MGNFDKENMFLIANAIVSTIWLKVYFICVGPFINSIINNGNSFISTYFKILYYYSFGNFQFRYTNRSRVSSKDFHLGTDVFGLCGGSYLEKIPYRQEIVQERENIWFTPTSATFEDIFGSYMKSVIQKSDSYKIPMVENEVISMAGMLLNSSMAVLVIFKNDGPKNEYYINH